MTKLRDYHLHSKYSFDSNEEPENICNKAIELGVEEICFTEHFEFAAPAEDAWTDIDAWNLEIDILRYKFEGKLSILQGIEAGQPYREPDRAQMLMEKLQDRLDFVIGSLHIVGNNGRPSKYEFTRTNYQDYFKEYFDEAKKMAEFSDFDVMGHITFPFRYPIKELIAENPIESYEADIRELFGILIHRGKGIEINTSGYRTSLEESMPGEKLIGWYQEQGGRIITVGSDGHSCKSACLNIEKGYQIVEELKINCVSHYKKRNLVSI